MKNPATMAPPAQKMPKRTCRKIRIRYSMSWRLVSTIAVSAAVKPAARSDLTRGDGVLLAQAPVPSPVHRPLIPAATAAQTVPLRQLHRSWRTPRPQSPAARASKYTARPPRTAHLPRTPHLLRTWHSSAASIRGMGLLTVRAAATQLGVGYSTFKRWVHSGHVRTTRTEGGHHRVSESEIERLLARQQPQARRRRPAADAEEALSELSARNRLPGFVEEVRIDGLLAQVRLRVGPLLAHRRHHRRRRPRPEIAARRRRDRDRQINGGHDCQGPPRAAAPGRRHLRGGARSS